VFLRCLAGVEGTLLRARREEREEGKKKEKEEKKEKGREVRGE